MIVFLLNAYIALLLVLVWLKFIRLNLFWKISPILVFILLLVGFFIPMNWGAPSGPALLGRQSVAIVPNVAGEVIDVPVKPNTPLKAGDVLFRIDPVPYDAQFRARMAQFSLAELRLKQMQALAGRQATPEFNVEQRQAESDALRADVDEARWNLDKTVVRAPADGYVTNLALRVGARVAPSAPAMAFIDTSETVILVEIAQNDARYIESGQMAEVTFKFLPGQIFTGTVTEVLQAISTGQRAPSGTASTPTEFVSAPFTVRVALDSAEIGKRLPAGSAGTAAIYTAHFNATHIIRKVLIRQTALLNYVLPF
ncbi:HlyD family secretion protein [Beijerinckia mobilis]|uniref:HlyD family secretion protein n=1 Tax=Beijerinckia mobilis TaxID=231434 RepID=UPI000552F1E6|nr:efflux RND transporter periplasmic adaptor subunit [Beijerinckia mobilis]